MGNKRGLVLLLAIAAIALALSYYYLVYGQGDHVPQSFVVNNSTYQITAYEHTSQQLEQGLMNVTVTNRTFALFYFGEPGIYPFWMKDTYSQLDMIWLNYSQSTGMGMVVYIANATPCADYDSNQTNCIIYTPTAYANYVLEAKAGFVQQNQIRVGTSIRFYPNK